MNRDKISVKHLLSIHKDLLGYPSIEDLSYEISKWYWQDGGLNVITNNTSVTETSHPVFSKQILTDNIKLPEKRLDGLIEAMIRKGIITITRATQHNTYYRFETNDYK